LRGALIERRKGLAARRRQCQEALPAIRLRRRLRQQSAPFEALQDAAEISRIETKVVAELRGGEQLAIRQFVEHACFGERKGAVQQALLQYAEAPRVKAGEMAHGIDLRFASGGGQARSRVLPNMCYGQLII